MTKNQMPNTKLRGMKPPQRNRVLEGGIESNASDRVRNLGRKLPV
jgi:hypothetical protein